MIFHLFFKGGVRRLTGEYEVHYEPNEFLFPMAYIKLKLILMKFNYDV